MHLLMASITELSKQDTRDLRAKAVALVNESKGYISLEDCPKTQGAAPVGGRYGNGG